MIIIIILHIYFLNDDIDNRLVYSGKVETIANNIQRLRYILFALSRAKKY